MWVLRVYQRDGEEMILQVGLENEDVEHLSQRLPFEPSRFASNILDVECFLDFDADATVVQ